MPFYETTTYLCFAGKMEMFSKKFATKIREIFTTENNLAVLATIPNKISSGPLATLIALIKSNKNSKVIEVTKSNRNDILDEIVSSLIANT